LYYLKIFAVKGGSDWSTPGVECVPPKKWIKCRDFVIIMHNFAIFKWIRVSPPKKSKCWIPHWKVVKLLDLRRLIIQSSDFKIIRFFCVNILHIKFTFTSNQYYIWAAYKIKVFSFIFYLCCINSFWYDILNHNIQLKARLNWYRGKIHNWLHKKRWGKLTSSYWYFV